MLGETREEEDRHERGRIARWLYTLPWAGLDVKAHDGYAHDQFYGLLDGQEPSSRFPWCRVTWKMWRCFNAIQVAQRRLDAKVNVA